MGGMTTCTHDDWDKVPPPPPPPPPPQPRVPFSARAKHRRSTTIAHLARPAHEILQSCRKSERWTIKCQNHLISVLACARVCLLVHTRDAKTSSREGRSRRKREAIVATAKQAWMRKRQETRGRSRKRAGKRVRERARTRARARETESERGWREREGVERVMRERENKRERESNGE
eukprot:6200664-Pleurochrysis_carterae.AAC.1